MTSFGIRTCTQNMYTTAQHFFPIEDNYNIKHQRPEYQFLLHSVTNTVSVSVTTMSLWRCVCLMTVEQTFLKAKTNMTESLYTCTYQYNV